MGLTRTVKEPRLLNVCYMKCSISWIITLEAVLCFLLLASSAYYLIKWNSSERKADENNLPVLVIMAIVTIVVFFIGLVMAALLGRSLTHKKTSLVYPYLIWKAIVIILIVPAVIWLSLALTILPDYCGGLEPSYGRGDSRCVWISAEVGVLAGYFVLSIIFFIYASLVLAFFRQTDQQKKAQAKALVIQRKLSNGMKKTIQRRPVNIYGSTVGAAYPPIYGTLRPPPAPQYRPYGGNQLAIGYYYT